MDNKNQILEKIRSDTSLDEITCEELEKQLDSELAKSSPDLDLVDELTVAILEARGMNVKEVDVQDEIATIRRKGIRRFRCPKWAVAVCAVCVTLIGANMMTVSAWGTNIVSSFIKITNSGVHINFNKMNHEVHLPTSDDDPYGFIAKLAEYDIEFETPRYIPDGFILTHIDTNVSDFSSDVHFIYENDKQRFSLDFEKFYGVIPEIVIPSDHYNISITEVNGSPAIVSKEDNQYTITYEKDKTVFFFFSQDVPYHECESIVASIK